MYQIPELTKYKDLVHGFSTTDEGNMGNFFNGVKPKRAGVTSNRKNFLNKLHININSCICLWVVHSKKVVEITPGRVGKSMTDLRCLTKADAIITNKKNTFLFIVIADCMPVIFYDPVKKAIALMHAGWIGVDMNISREVIIKLKLKYGCNPKDIIAAIGPCARKESFIKKNPSQKNDPKWKGYIKPVAEDTYRVDFVGLCKKELLDAGVQPQNIIDSGIDTVKDSRFFSYYRDVKNGLPDQGRFAAVVGLI